MKPRMMPLLENKFLCCNHVVIPKIVMSTYNKTEETSSSEENNSYMCGMYANSPEIRCSPTPCVFDEHASSNHRTSSPDSDCSPRFRRRSLRRSASPVSPGSRRGSVLAPGYEQYQKSLLEVPCSTDYGDASSDDLSSEWDSDVPDVPPLEQPKVRKWKFNNCHTNFNLKNALQTIKNTISFKGNIFISYLENLKWMKLWEYYFSITFYCITIVFYTMITKFVSITLHLLAVNVKRSPAGPVNYKQTIHENKNNIYCFKNKQNYKLTEN